MAIADRRQGWLTDGFHGAFRDIMHRLSGKYRVVIPVYCLMPDHLHILAAGIGSDSDQLLWSKSARRALNLLLAPHRLQKQAYDHVLRPNESRPDAFTVLAFYIAENPVRAGLSVSAGGWPYVGSAVPALPGLGPQHGEFRDSWWAYWNALES